MRKFLIALLLLPIQLIAQSVAPLHFEKVNGLSQNTVYSIMKDRQGFLWIATADGLNRYDGVEMKIYKPLPDNGKGGYKNRVVRSRLLEDTEDRIWFSTGAGLYYYDQKKDVFNHCFISFNNNNNAWAIDPVWYEKGHFWGANGAMGFAEYEVKTNRWMTYPTKPAPESPTNFSKTVWDEQGNAWCMAGKGILHFNRESRKWEHLLSDRTFNSIGYAGETVFLMEGKHLYKLHTANRVLTEIAVSGTETYAPIRVFCTDRAGQVWAGDENGNIFCMKKGATLFAWMGNINGFPLTGTSYPVYSLFADENDLLWVGADVLGLQKTSIANPRFAQYPPPGKGNPAQSLFIHSILEDEQDKIWLGTFRNGLQILDKKTGKARQVKLPGITQSFIDDNSVSMIRRDSRGNLWIGGYRHLYIKEKGKEALQIIDIPEPPFAHQEQLKALSMLEYRDSLFFTTSWGIYSIYKKEGAYKVNYYPENGTGFYSDLFIDPSGYYWLAIENGVIRKKILNGEHGKNRLDTLLFSGVGVKSFHADDERNLLWISTTSGLIAWHLPTGRHRLFSEKDGLGNSYIYGVLQNKNELWVSTNRGLSRALIGPVDKNSPIPEISFLNFTSSDGLPDDEFNTGAFHLGAGGQFYFGTIQGVVWFNPEQLFPATTPPKIVLTRILVNDEVADSSRAPEYTTALNLDHQHNNLSFYFRGIEYQNPKKVQYTYQLEGWDKTWINSGTLNQVRYNNLPPGEYTFRIKAANAAGYWTSQPQEIRVYIAPPFWKTWWFYTLTVLLLFGSVVYTTRLLSQQKLRKKVAYLEQQRELDKERQRISREMHDDLGAGLTQIALMSESARRRQQRQEGNELFDIAETSRRLMGSMSEIVWSLNPDNKNLEQLFVYLREQFHKLLEYSGMEYSIDLPEGIELLVLRNEQRRNILLITKEIINNAIKYSEATCLKISAELKGRNLGISISDNGKGFDPDRPYTGNGLRNIRHRVEEINGTLEIRSSPETGTSFNLYFPL
jgi:signal transduction histidine kinase/ligand-binding sensor domain-containing protein